jgi:hypothetical protein
LIIAAQSSRLFTGTALAALGQSVRRGRKCPTLRSGAEAVRPSFLWRLKDFYRDHALNSGAPEVRKICRTAVKEYVRRIREALSVAFQKAALPLDPKHVLVSEATDGNEVHYHLEASIEWIHVDDLAERHHRIRKGD